MGGFSNFAISFCSSSILTGAVLLYGYGLEFAGPVLTILGWPVVSLMTPTIGHRDYVNSGRVPTQSSPSTGSTLF